MGVNVYGISINNIRYADDTILIAETIEFIERVTRSEETGL